MKACKHCEAIKPLDGFYRHARMADGHLNVCIPCRDKYVRDWNDRNRDRRKQIANKHARANYTPEKAKASFDRWYSTADKSRMCARVARRRATQMRATPAWANAFFIDETYRLAQLRTQVTGIEWQVDHVVPLQSQMVCGLHTEQNLRVIPARVNQSKKNYYWPDMPTNGDN